MSDIVPWDSYQHDIREFRARAEAAESRVADFDRIERKWIAENTRLRQALVDIREKCEGNPRNIEPRAIAERASLALGDRRAE